MSPYLRTVKTSSDATAVQIVHSSRRGSRQIQHIGSAHSGAEVELLKAAARQRLAAGQGELAWAWIPRLLPDGHVFTQPWPAGPGGGRRDQVIYYQYRADRARRTPRGIGEQVAQAEQAVAGKAPVKRNRFIRLSGGTRAVNRELEEKARALAGLKGYVTSLRTCPDGTLVTPDLTRASRLVT